MMQQYRFEPLQPETVPAAVELALVEYRREKQSNYALLNLDYSEKLTEHLSQLFSHGKGLVMYHDEKISGYLGYFVGGKQEEDGFLSAYCPVCGYGITPGSDRSKVISLLFQRVSELLLPMKVRNFIQNLYAHDEEIIRSFVHNQFGMICSDAIRRLKSPISGKIPDGINFREFTGQQIEDNKPRLLEKWRKLADHLQQSPAYYFSEEFTDEMFLEYINEPETRLFIAGDSDGTIVGITDTHPSGNSFFNNDTATVNIGDLYIDLGYRETGIAAGLLRYVNDTLLKEGYERLWVEHGTVNPNALHFWNKHFTPCVHQLTRSIDTRVALRYIEGTK